jgi:hypothetical protein
LFSNNLGIIDTFNRDAVGHSVPAQAQLAY